MSISKQQNVLTAKEFPEEMTTFDYYAEKYRNFKAFVKEIATYYPEISKWSNYLDKMNLAVFISLAEPALKSQANGKMGELFLHEMNENGVDPDKINEDDMTKLHRYADLFTIMLSD